MKVSSILILCIPLCLFCHYVAAQTKYSAKDAIKHINCNITICDTISKVQSLGPRLHYFYFASPASNHQIIVIDKSLKKNLDYSFMVGHEVCITGIIHYVNKKYVIYLKNKMLYLGPIDL
jgi:hypothetical protein